ncbi:crotonobetainyl-CoA:carnitine CoA-transferase CaiB-like acyl-CoA transferase [Rhodococcus wratislaviensis]|uniref:Acyl-CoA transferase n=1 Tax=Rhodococcus wratislaviensis TaxID=44752 RepID=A0AB38FNK8_RHOWR|nr:CoA transferase [Rhodococcus wratislaviensis]REE72481.1 crotonobetainyl-CoA:carnitine CoA-transferase CaiB-like acyl-CoA transferase [Rhodococcus wratislaviensis]SPZ42873.1 acyl-CoA transferase [Rhodococcus wratislaviensis]
MKLLDGIRVLDLTNVLAGPYASYQLSLMGADVIKVEVPGSGDLARQLGADTALSSQMLGASFVAQNAGKRSITVNLKSAAGRNVFDRLIAGADVLVENFRPGVLARLGYSWDELHAMNPRLVYCAISGFGQTGPMRERPAYDQIIQGLSGMSAVTGTPDTAPLRVGFPVCDTLGGMTAAMAINGALASRARTGEGVYLDVSMLESSLTALGWVVSDYLIAGRQPSANGNENPTGAPSATFQTGSGALNIAANKQEQFEILCKLIGRENLIDDPRFALRDDRKNRRPELRVEIESALAAKSAREWEPLLNEAGVPAGLVLDVTASLDLDQITERELVHQVDLPDRTVSVLGTGFHVNGRPLAPASAPPTLSEHTDELLTDLGFTADEITDLHTEGAV